MSRLGASLYAIPALLALLGLSVALVATQGRFWPFALAWAAGLLLVVALRRVVAPSRVGRLLLAGTAVVACPILTFEGGLFLLPAALALFVLDVRSDRHRPASVGRGS